MEEQKNHWRVTLKGQRSELTPAERSAHSQTITESCLGLINWERADRIHCYQSIADLHEVETERLVAAFRRHGAAVDAPSVSARQPTAGELDATYDIIIVPMLGFDDRLHRLGYGGGYYDRLLTAHPTAYKIGLCYEMGHVPTIPAGRHDQPLDAVVTEHRVYRAQLV